ncbi:hypothetical protein FQR65_LT06223 [Abscondita terminalis]|nr:hypothetical protein FQR65_LT06223 [Abscondita terminalis]
MLNLKTLCLCLLIQNIQCCTQSTFEATRITALKNINFRDEITDYNYFIKAPRNDFQEVVAIQIRGEQVPIIYENAVQNLPFLHSLHIELSNVAIIKPRAFQNLPSLTILKIEDNNLEVIQPQVFNDLLVKKLILTYNRITYIVSNAFDNMPLLESIRLDHNRLAAWTPEWFQNCPNMNLISVKFNQLTSIPQNAFQNVNEHLERLYIGHNKLKEVNLEAFRGLNSLTDLGLDHNSISKIENDTFSHLKKLRVIDLSGTDITCFSEEFLNTLRNDVLLWIDSTGFNETCKTLFNEWINNRQSNN